MVQGGCLGVGLSSGDVQIWDAEKCSLVKVMRGHTDCASSLVWNPRDRQLLASGSRDSSILLRDARASSKTRLSAHRGQVCGLKWSCDGQELASGSNDNELLLWSVKAAFKPVCAYPDHKGAIKAIAWSPHKPGVLVSGGGNKDCHIRVWNTLVSEEESRIAAVNTASQVCNLICSQTSNEIVSTHGYSINQIAIYHLPTLQQVPQFLF